MIVLDENIVASQCALLRSWRIHFRQLGHDIGTAGIQDDDVLRWLKGLRALTFFTGDLGFFERRFLHAKYCLVCMDVRREEMAIFARRFLQHPDFSTQAKRLGKVVTLSHANLHFFELDSQTEHVVQWPRTVRRKRRRRD